jgi:hypothetical protein
MTFFDFVVHVPTSLASYCALTKEAAKASERTKAGCIERIIVACLVREVYVVKWKSSDRKSQFALLFQSDPLSP